MEACLPKEGKSRPEPFPESLERPAGINTPGMLEAGDAGTLEPDIEPESDLLSGLVLSNLLCLFAPTLGGSSATVTNESSLTNIVRVGGSTSGSFLSSASFAFPE